MTQYTFKPKDFKAFEVEGLDARMEALNEYVRPQLHQLEIILVNISPLKLEKLFMLMLQNMHVEV